MDLKKQNFIHVIESNRGLIISLCKAYYGNDEDQKDVFQDIILQLWKSFDTFRGESSISTWLYRVSLNTILAKVRNEKNKIETEPISGSEHVFSNAKADDDRELMNMVFQSLKGLDKGIVILYLEGYKNHEIAHILNITPTNISTRLNRVKEQLKIKFKSHPYEFK